MKKGKLKIKDEIEEDEEDMEVEPEKKSKKDKGGSALASALLNQKVRVHHKMVLDNLSGNVGKKGKGKGKRGVSMKKAMIEEGYSESYADSGHIKKTRSWDILMKEVLNDEFLMEQHRELFNAKQVERFIFPTRLKDEEIIEMINDAGFKVITIRPSPLGKMAFYSIPNARAKKDALEFAFKLKGKFEPEQLNLKFAGFNKQQLIEFIMGKITKKK